jgi:hypothetical protein
MKSETTTKDDGTVEITFTAESEAEKEAIEKIADNPAAMVDLYAAGDHLIPFATMHVECKAMKPPKPIGLAVVADGHLIALVSYDEAKRAVEEYERMRANVSSASHTA